ncbi:hypothetical protein [Clostridium cylindrosporum]|uniref:Uncharacterized protein n=1 Tax=Clostridium cylindrosporum DSM 605 TaxID=1121307 RepID=A0A0J8DAN5_CLOCY|nr:hypothetical protein [Clostridium cylindrosporum]KMT21379.1 hypothetical protein CLCY_2c01390 [Clostridium cylindrosporum DSM 605]
MIDCYIMKLPELNCLRPNEQTTFKKLVEEVAECNYAIESLREYEEINDTNCLLLSDSEVYRIREEYKVHLNNVMGEIMDIAQVCASQLFVFENKKIDVQSLFNGYMNKYSVDEYKKQIIFELKGNCRYIHFAPTDRNLNLEKTMNLIIFSMGKIAQLGKFVGDNGEIPVIDQDASNTKYVYELFSIVQNCFNLLYSMEEKYNINIKKIFDDHVIKLINKGYCKI